MLRGDRSKAEFAREIGVSAPLYQNYENGRVPAADKLSLISQKTGKSVDWLLGHTDATPVAIAAAEAKESGGADEEEKIIGEITERLRWMKAKAKPGRDRLKNAIIHRLDEYSDYCEDHYADLRKAEAEVAQKVFESKKSSTTVQVT